GSVCIVDRLGQHRRVLAPNWPFLRGLTWTRGGSELWFGASRTGQAGSLHAVNLAGRARDLIPLPGTSFIQDAARDGRLLVSLESVRGETRIVRDGRDTDFSWQDQTKARDIAADGQQVLLDEDGEAGGPLYSVFLRPAE